MYIEVQRSKLTSAANVIDQYLRDMKNQMEEASTEVRDLSNDWFGADYLMFRSQWNDVTAPGSVYHNWKTELGNYATFLRNSEGAYKKTQKAAIDRANALPW